ncbi:MAG: DUF4331 domain-containing protein [Pyrinomonadaceae bacterium]
MPCSVFASSHMDAPLITRDDPANTTDVYAFVRTVGRAKFLSTALSVYPFEEPGIGPNAYDFDPSVLYQIHVATGSDLAAGRATYSYQFQFATRYKNRNTVLQSYLGVVQNVDDANQNRTQTYTITKVDNRTNERTVLGTGIVPPNNQGRVTPKYNRGNDGDNPAKDGVSTNAALDDYTRQSIFTLSDGSAVFAGQRDDGFYADIQSIFDLDFAFSGPNKPFDSQGGFNVHSIVLNIPLGTIGGDQQVVGVYATTSRRTVTVLSERLRPVTSGRFVQVGRQGNPLFNEGLVALADKDFYNRSSPTVDSTIFRKYAETPELAAALGLPANLQTNRIDIASIFIPDLIKVDLSTRAARRAGSGPTSASNPDDAGFHRLGIFGGDTLTSAVQPGFGNGIIPGGWPNGRRFGDDVVDIAVMALASDLRTSPPPLGTYCTPSGDVHKVSRNDIGYNKVIPYAGTPLNGRNHGHHGR